MQKTLSQERGVTDEPVASSPRPSQGATSASHSSSSSGRPRGATHSSESSGHSSSLERTQSNSSVSSANSTSSIEAVPFRAPPRGNVRSYGSQHTLSPDVDALPWPHRDSLPEQPEWSLDAHNETRSTQSYEPERSNDTAQSTPMAYTKSLPLRPSSGSATTPRMKHVVKPANDTWIFRNGPGLSNTRRSPMLVPTNELEPESLPQRKRTPLDTSRPAPPIDYSTMMSTVTSAPMVVAKRFSRPSSRTSYRSRHAESTLSRNSDVQRTPDAPPKMLEGDETSLASGSSVTSIAVPQPPPAAGRPTPAEIVRMEAQAGTARVPNTPGMPSEAEERGQWRARTQDWVQNLRVPPSPDAPAPDESIVDRVRPLPSGSRRDTNSSRLSDWTMDATRVRSSNRSSSSTLMPRSPSPDHRTNMPSYDPASPRTRPTPQGPAPHLATHSEGTLSVPMPSISAQMGHYGYLVPTTEVMNPGLLGRPLGDEPVLTAEASGVRPMHAATTLPVPRPPIRERASPSNDTEMLRTKSPAPSRRRTPSDFIFGEVLGEGSYSTVIKAWDLNDIPESQRAALQRRPSALEVAAGHDGAATLPGGVSARAYAVKVLDKVHILKEKKQKYVRVEKEALSLLLHRRGVVTLYHTFQDRESLYFVLELAPNGEFLHYLQRLGSLDMASASFYAAQLADAIAGIHEAGVIHRDIKPENMLLDANMRILVTDFGSAKILGKLDSAPRSLASSTVSIAPTEASDNSQSSRGSFVGTAEYVSPELLGEKTVGIPSDWWAFGCVLYQMLAGHSPFKAANEYQTFQRILHRRLSYPPRFPDVAIELIDQLLSLEPEARPGAKKVKGSAFFAQTDFPTIWTNPVPEMKQGIVAKKPGTGRSFSDGLKELESSFNAFQAHDASSPPSSHPTRDSTLSPSGVTGDEASVSSSDEARSFSPLAVRHTAPMPAIHVATSAVPETSHNAQDSSFMAEMYDDLMLPNEVVSYSSPIVLKRTGAGGMFSKRCQLLLTSYPRLLCVRESTRTLKVLCEVILRPVPPDAADDPRGAGMYAALERTTSQRSATTRQRRSHSLRSQPSLPAMSFQSMNALSRGLSRMGANRTASDAYSRYPSSGTPSSVASQSETNMPASLGRSSSSREDTLRSPLAKESTYDNWLLSVETKAPRSFIVNTVRRPTNAAWAGICFRGPSRGSAILGTVHSTSRAPVRRVPIVMWRRGVACACMQARFGDPCVYASAHQRPCVAHKQRVAGVMLRP